MAQLSCWRMADRGLIETGPLGVELSAACCLEGKGIKTCRQRVEGITRVARLVAEQKAAALMQHEDPGAPGIARRNLEFPDEDGPGTRPYQPALTLMSRTVSAVCSARSTVGIGASRKTGLEAHVARSAGRASRPSGNAIEHRGGYRVRCDADPRSRSATMTKSHRCWPESERRST